MDQLDKAILKCLSTNIPICKRPYEVIAKELGSTEKDVIERIQALKSSGKLKRIAPILYHNKTSYRYNALTAWCVTKKNVKQVAEYMMERSNISHVYERETAPKWPYNVYGMMHGTSEEDIENMVQAIAEEFPGLEYKVVYTKKEWKKTSPNLEYLLK